MPHYVELSTGTRVEIAEHTVRALAADLIGSDLVPTYVVLGDGPLVRTDEIVAVWSGHDGVGTVLALGRQSPLPGALDHIEPTVQITLPPHCGGGPRFVEIPVSRELLDDLPPVLGEVGRQAAALLAADTDEDGAA